jgi:uncharacterized protein (DUF302 family)
LPFDEAVDRVGEALASEGFGVLTDIDIKETINKKLGLDFRRYRILGACNPPMAHRALELEDRIGTMLPCNVVVQERSDGRVEVSAIDPVAAMAVIENPQLQELASAVRKKLGAAITAL